MTSAATHRDDIGSGEYRKLQGHMTNATDAEHSDTLSGPEVELRNGAERGDSRAEQRSSINQVDGLRHVIAVRRIREHKLRVRAVYVLTRDLALMAEFLAAGEAELALLARPPQRLHTNPITDLECRHARTKRGYRAGRLVPGDDRADGRHSPINPIALDHVQIRAAHPARRYFDQQLPWAGLGSGDLAPGEWMFRQRGRSI